MTISADTIIIGGSYAGLSAAMALGRSLRKVAIIDSGLPCNRQTPASHNFLSRDGIKPASLAAISREQVSTYDTISFYQDILLSATMMDGNWHLTTAGGKLFSASKVIFATGIKDILPPIPGLAECWGITAIHCPYCHGYEVRDAPTGILASGDTAMEMAGLIRNWTSDLRIFTNGSGALTAAQLDLLHKKGITIYDSPVTTLDHDAGYLKNIQLANESLIEIKALYIRPEVQQHCDVPALLGCELTPTGHIKTDMLQKTTVPGLFACGDMSSPMRSVAQAVYSGSMAGAAVNKELCTEAFT